MHSKTTFDWPLYRHATHINFIHVLFIRLVMQLAVAVTNKTIPHFFVSTVQGSSNVVGYHRQCGEEPREGIREQGVEKYDLSCSCHVLSSQHI